MTGTVHLWTDGAIAEIALANGPLNLVTRDLLRALCNALSAVSNSSETRGLAATFSKRRSGVPRLGLPSTAVTIVSPASANVTGTM